MVRNVVLVELRLARRARPTRCGHDGAHKKALPDHFYMRTSLCILFACQHNRLIIRDACSMYDSINETWACLG